MINKNRKISLNEEYLILNLIEKNEVYNKNLKLNMDYLLSDEKHIFAGRHIIFDFFNSPYINNIEYIENSLKESVEKAGAEILHSHFHIFHNNGLSGILILKESHASIHTWPESNILTLDIFMCGLCNPYVAFEYLKEKLKPSIVKIMFLKRGSLS